MHAQQHSVIKWKWYISGRSDSIISPKTQARYIKMCPNAYDPKFFYTIISLPVCIYGPAEEFLWSVDRGTENSGLVFAWYAHTTGKSTAIVHYSSFLRYLWRTTVKGNPVRRQNFKHCTLVCLFGHKNYLDMQLYIYWFMDCDQCFGWMVRDL